MNTYNIYNIQEYFNDKRQENKRILESSKKQIRTK